MTPHAITEYLKYKWTAKGRHGTHSPFVYALVEDVLQSKAYGNAVPVAFPSTDSYYNKLAGRICQYYHYQSILSLPVEEDEHSGSYDLLILQPANPAEWAGNMDKYKGLIANDSMVIVAGIHSTAAHTAAWEALCNLPYVRASMDLYGIGLLFFKEEFKERQHFVLRNSL